MVTEPPRNRALAGTESADAGGIVLVAHPSSGDQGSDRGWRWGCHVHPSTSPASTSTAWPTRCSLSTGTSTCWVNNAGRAASVRCLTASDYERTMSSTTSGPVKLILKLLPVMRERKSGHIVNVSSSGCRPTPAFSACVASKSALDAFSRCIASESSTAASPSAIYRWLPDDCADEMYNRTMPEGRRHDQRGDHPPIKRIATPIRLSAGCFCDQPEVDRLHPQQRLAFPRLALRWRREKPAGAAGEASNGRWPSYLMRGVHW
jgi:NAD(P)-dependent dehydrogenase (short-subunit alcohol dehydrogenase family)